MVEASSAVWVEQWRTWLVELAARHSHTRVLGRRQRLAIWQQIVHNRAPSASVLNLPAVASWANDAWTVLRRYAIDDASEYGDSRDLRSLLTWGAAYDNLLRERDWADHESILQKFVTDPIVAPLAARPRDLVLLGIDDMPPLEARCLQRLEAAGWNVARRDFPIGPGNVSVRPAASPAEEIELAMNWLHGRLGEKPSHRVALVAEHDNMLHAIVRRRSGEWPEVAFARGSAPLEMPAIGAALNALEMLGPEGDSLQLSSWLRSPFMQDLDPKLAGDSARFEIARRDMLASQLPLQRTRDGLLSSLRSTAPGAGARLAQAFEHGDRLGKSASLAEWAVLWRNQLTALEWTRGAPQSVREQAMSAIERAFDAAAALGAVAGAVGATRALEELRSILAERLLGSPLPLRGLHVLERLDDVGPGYAAVWVAGMGQVDWPPRPQHNPLLPRRLMHELRVPWGSREDCLERAATAVQRVAGLAPAVVFSFSPGDDEDQAQPSTMLRRWFDESDSRTPRTTAAPPASEQAILPAAANLETVAESVQRLRTTRLPGGAGLLNAQASCPLRTFIDYRLRARSLQPWQRGLPPALRGKILHRAAARLFEPGTDLPQLATGSGIDWHARIDSAAEHALHREIGDARVWFAALAAMEQTRVRQALLRLLEAERARSAFTVEAVETPVRLSIDEFEISARVDRLDRLAAGGFAVIDYKTGRSPAQPHWFDDRHADYQLPLYAVALGESVTALVLCTLGPDAAIYRGYWPKPDTFPGTVQRRDDSLEWSGQLERWHGEITALIRAFASGDVAFDSDARSQLAGAYAPLSRIAEADFVRSAAESS